MVMNTLSTAAKRQPELPFTSPELNAHTQSVMTRCKLFEVVKGAAGLAYYNLETL